MRPKHKVWYLLYFVNVAGSLAGALAGAALRKWPERYPERCAPTCAPGDLEISTKNYENKRKSEKFLAARAKLSILMRLRLPKCTCTICLLLSFPKF